MNIFGQHIRQLRQERGLSQRALALHAGIDFTYLNKIETGSLVHLPSEAAILRIAQVLEVDGNELVSAAGKVPPKLKTMMQHNVLLTELVRVLSERVLPESTYQKLLKLAKEAKYE